MDAFYLLFYTIITDTMLKVNIRPHFGLNYLGKFGYVWTKLENEAADWGSNELGEAASGS